VVECSLVVAVERMTGLRVELGCGGSLAGGWPPFW
jgi:hypothetical protein